jgi:hypothetical protein
MQLQRTLNKPTTNTAFRSIEVGRHLPVTWFDTEFTAVAVTLLFGVLYSDLSPDLTHTTFAFVFAAAKRAFVHSSYQLTQLACTTLTH